MKILILSKFLSKITNLNQKIIKNIKFESIFIRNHKFEKNHENVNFDSIFIKNHKFESNNYKKSSKSIQFLGIALRREIFSRRRAASRNLQSASRCVAKFPVGVALRRAASRCVALRRAASRCVAA